MPVFCFGNLLSSRCSEGRTEYDDKSLVCYNSIKAYRFFWIRRTGLKKFWPVLKYGLLTKCEVKMALAKFFFPCLWTETKSRSINSQKKERGQYPAILTEQTWSIKDLLYGVKGNFACGIQRVVPSGQDRSILPARVANHSARFASSCPLAELSIY